MKTKTYTKRIIAISAMLLALFLFVFLGQKFYFRQGDANHVRLQGFYLEDKNSLDIVLLGASEVHNDFSSAEAYKVSGITSYPFGVSANSPALWKYELKEIMKRQNPKVLVVELNGACYGTDNLYKYAPLRHFSDAMPFSQNKRDLIDNIADKFTDEDKLSFYMPIFKYHGNIKRNPLSTVCPFLNGHNVLRGAFSHPGIITETMNPIEYTKVNPNPKDLDPDAEKYLLEFIDACEEMNVENVLFVQFPHLIVSNKAAAREQRYMKLESIITERGYIFLNLSNLQTEMGIIPEEDYFDGDHLNIYGQKKLTHWFIDYLVNEYDLEPTELSDKQKSQWDESAEYIDLFYEYYEEYLLEHPNPSDRVKELHEDYAIMKELKSKHKDARNS